MNVSQQIERGILVCPETKQKLQITAEGGWLENSEKTRRYRFSHGQVPLLLLDDKWAAEYVNDSPKMTEEYSQENINSFATRIRHALTHVHRAKASERSFHALFDHLEEDDICLSIGGGPTREHQKLLNVNIGPFPNVDVVADAHCLPYADKSVDAVYCEAVFEHLHTPVKAAQEMFRVLRHGGRAFVCTPFLQPYHGYPHHYQNYTLTGHKLLFESNGFRIVEAGACVGPAYAIMQMGATFINVYIPKPFNQILRAGWSLLSILVRPLDKILGEAKNAYVMASTTYAIIEKP
jgi:SAM-dependent methyltransferase